MQVPGLFQASVLRQPSPSARCTCRHWVHCDHACHGRVCDPTENACDIAFLPDEGGLTAWGCPDCTPGKGSPHYLGCELIGWNVPLGPDRMLSEQPEPTDDPVAWDRGPTWPVLTPPPAGG